MQAQAGALGLSCDVFCKVVDNFGDAAVAWRLARILADEQHFAVRLCIDNPRPLAQLLGLAQLDVPVEIEHVQVMGFDAAQGAPADIVIETFDCGLPAAYASKLQAGSKPPAWINVDYLSAEPWVEDFHRLPSPPAGGGALRHYFFPGLTAATGGVLREHDLFSRRQAFLADDAARLSLLAKLGVACDAPEAPKVLMFCYPKGWPADLFSRIACAASAPLHLVVPQGVLCAQVSAFCGQQGQGASAREGPLQVSVVPFLAQSQFDALLWALDGVVVRGEDSFVRAQLSGRPMLWDIYPQSENTHLKKLHAFLNRYEFDLAPEQAKELTQLNLALVDRSADFAHRFTRWCGALDRYRQGSERWRQQLAVGPELGAELGNFARKLLEY